MSDNQAHARRDTVLAAIAFLIVMIGTTLPTPLYALYEQQLGFGPTWLTLIFSTYAAGVIAALLVAGGWSDQLGRRPMMFAAIAMSAISAVVFLSWQSIPGLLVGRLFSGFSAGIMTGTGTVAVIELAPKAWRGLATLIATGANMLGLGLGPLLAGITSQYLPWPLHLSYSGHLVMLGLATLFVAMIRESAQRPAKPRLQVQRPSIPAQVRPLFIPACIAGLAGFGVAGLFTSMVPSIMGQLMAQKGGAVIGAVICMFFIASTTGQALMKWLPEHRHMTFGCSALILGMLAFGYSIASHQVLWLLLGAIISGAGQGIAFRAGMAAVTAATPADQKAAVTSALFIVLYGSMATPVIAVGVSVPSFGLSHVGELFAGLVALVALVALVSMAVVQGRRSSEPA
ncbi:MFS transporter [Pseudomonas sp. dw_358]|uniref:MFS transporter n=1 Tax=Pseudomonas sp. dw_358 TaxID=2720083 RepID=UPI001BD6B901|nr:MFS transporter [Pseudomonas sp. dw_358]